ncbi:MAG TPA: TRAP transporter small permease [Spirochaetales bacterium]|nr:TRAP transporter small permease [Spirochaetales bacterium]HOV38743.1 TRAP transporter small permease [Spirochaetales bacterium]
MVKKIVSFFDTVQFLLFVVFVGLSFIQVIFRYVLNNSIYWAEEVSRYMFIWLVFLGSALCTRRRNHIVMDIVSNELKGWTKKIVQILTNCILFFFMLVLVREGVRMLPTLWNQYSSALGIPMAFVYGAVPVGAVLTGFYLIIDTYLIFVDRVPEPEEESKEDDDNVCVE